MVPVTKLRMARLADCPGAFVDLVQGENEAKPGLSARILRASGEDDPEAVFVNLAKEGSGIWSAVGTFLFASEARLDQLQALAWQLPWRIEVDPLSSIPFSGHGHMGSVVVAPEGQFLIVGQPRSYETWEVALQLPSCAQAQMPSAGPFGFSARAFPKWRLVVREDDEEVYSLNVDAT